MNVENVAAKAYEGSIFPGLSLSISIRHTKHEEAIVAINGWMKTDDGKIIAEINQAIEETKSSDLAARGSFYDSEFKPELYRATVITLLDRRAVEHIEKCRMNNKKGDVKLALNLNVKSLCAKTFVFHTYEIDPQSVGLNPLPPVKTSRGSAAASLLISAYDAEFRPPHGNRWLLSGNNGPFFLSVVEQNLALETTIPSSDWIHDYAPKLGLGEYFIVEIPKGAKTVEKAWVYIDKAEECYRKWDTKGAYGHCREVGQLLGKTIKEKFGNNPAIKKWNRAADKFNHLTSLDLHTEQIKDQEPLGYVEIGKAEVEHILIVTKALTKYAEELLQEVKLT